MRQTPGYSGMVPPWCAGNWSGQPTPFSVELGYEQCEGRYAPDAGELTAEQKAQEVALVNEIREREERVATWRAQVPNILASIDDPVTRLMAVVGSWGRLGLVRCGLYPDAALSDLDHSPPWDHDAVQRWFLEFVDAAPIELQVIKQDRSPLGGRKRANGTALGWSFVEGSTRSGVYTSEPGRYSGAANLYIVQTISVLRDGRRLTGSGLPAHPDEGFNFKAVQDMASISRVPRLPLPPPLSAREDRDDRLARERTPSTYAALQDIMESRGLRTQKF